ncbi:cation diffusion facilitator family transporter [Corynebacterium mustelae]|uniref:Cation diffusion facilitator family transporter n=1 Tax=Corynebacterium mustelae TaxID=571915 RepID=A0A0G3GYZ6_9CORY|nr:cation diffusion facilitator family transporter [Corynebacterium mustelae]AKK05735.1 cation diffusion facilitator family transporter [Corynebacterium mustelae]
MTSVFRSAATCHQSSWKYGRHLCKYGDSARRLQQPAQQKAHAHDHFSFDDDDLFVLYNTVMGHAIHPGMGQSMTTRQGNHEPSNHEHSHVHTHDHGGGHNHGHGHHHHHHHGADSLTALMTVLGFTATIFLAELIGGWVSGSLALISDAMHMLSDSTGLLVAALAITIARKQASAQATYGYKRIEVLAAFANAISVSAISVWIVYEAFERFNAGEEVNTTIMLVVGTIGLVANAIGAKVLHNHSHDNMNVRGAYLHVLVDLLGSVAVIVAAICMKFFDILWADTVASLLIAALILPRSLKLAWESLRVLLEQVPVGVDVEKISQSIENLPGVRAIHDLHVWSLDGTEIIASCHVVADSPSKDYCDILDQVHHAFNDLGIKHVTVQVEDDGHHAHEETCR